MNFGRLLSWSPDIKRKNALEGGGGGRGGEEEELFVLNLYIIYCRDRHKNFFLFIL